MTVPAIACPPDSQLAALGQGELDASAAEALRAHLRSCPNCAARRSVSSASDPHHNLPEPTTVPVTQLPPELAGLPQYSDLRELGRGGMGVVYLALNKLLNRREVLKVVNRQHLCKPGAKDRFLREVQSAARLQHPNVVTAYAAIEVDGSIVFAMEYVPGSDLAKVARNGPLSVRHACRYAVQALHGLQHAHERGMVHRDIKPANLILTRDGNKAVVKILDFGLAKITREQAPDAGLTREGQMMGTPDYLAPEQALDAASADIRADIYSLGCSLYFLLAGRLPFQGSSLADVLLKHQSATAEPLGEVRTDVPRELAAIVARMMAKRPADRYASPGEAAAALRPFTRANPVPRAEPVEATPISPSALSPTASASPAPTRTERFVYAPTARSNRRRIVFAALGILAVVALVAVWVGTRPKRGNSGTPSNDIATGRGDSPKADVELWRPLFTGSDLVGWRIEGTAVATWTLADGEMRAKVTRSDPAIRHFLLTPTTFGDVRLRFEFQLESGSDAGLVLRGTDDEQVPRGLSPQLMDGHPVIKLVDRDRFGPLQMPLQLNWFADGFGRRPSPVPDMSVGRWHTLDATVIGPRATLMLDGQRIWSVELDSESRNFFGIEPALKRATGRIGFQLNAGTLQVRKAELREPTADEVGAFRATPADRPRTAHLWKHHVGNRSDVHQLMADGRILGLRGAILGEWSMTNGGRAITLKWHGNLNKGKIFVDSLDSSDGVNFRGRNQEGGPISGSLADPPKS